MGRSDTYLLNVPRAEVDAAQPITEDVFSAQPAAVPPPARVEARPQPKPAPLTQCPYCKSRLSSVEAKMERCLSCGAQFDPAKRAVTDLPSGEFIVRI